MWWQFQLSFLIFVFLVCNTSSHSFSYPNEVLNVLKRIATPEGLAVHIENQLATNESRFISKGCWRHLKSYAKNLVTLNLWAFKMLDASAKPPSGLLRGYGAELGAFDQCLNIKHETENIGTIHGKYCFGGFSILKKKNYYPDGTIRENYSNSPIQSRLIDFTKATVDILWGVCLPDSCSARDFQILHKFLFMHFSEESCQTKADLSAELDGGDITAICLLGIIAGLIVFSTAYDVADYYLSKERGSTILRSFSICTNFSKIITTPGNENEISCIYGLRVLTMLMLMYGYRYVSFMFAPLINWLDMLDWITNKNSGSIIDAIVCGDTFFVISGFLVSYNYMRAKENGINFNILQYYVARIIRLTPALGMTILIHATLMRHIGSGPVWPYISNAWLVNSCRENWWTSLLYVQNYANPDITQMCMVQSWHLAVDMQLFILAPLILVPLSRWPGYTIGVVISLLFAAILSPFLAAWVYKLKAVVATNRSVDDINSFMEHFYFPTHTRAAPWIIGFLLGYLIYHTSRPEVKSVMKQKLNVFLVMIFWGITMGIFLFCILIGREMFDMEYDWVPNAFHMALIRPAWSIGISWIIFACIHGYGGPINSFLSLHFFEVLSRISYCTYLVNFSLLFLLTYQTRQGLEFSNFNAFYRYMGDILPSLGLGLVWSLAFESPFITIGKVVFRQREDKK